MWFNVDVYLNIDYTLWPLKPINCTDFGEESFNTRDYRLGEHKKFTDGGSSDVFFFFSNNYC